MRVAMSHSEPTSFRNFRGSVDILFDRRIFEYILLELMRFPNAEDGGKYIGHVLAAGDTRWGIGNPQAYRIVVEDFLPGGAKAKRTQVEFLPDGHYQDSLFRQAEQRDPSIEHVGTWHSHHCNGLDTLSGGDIKGYFATIKKPAYRLDFFIASLVRYIPRDPKTEGWIDHFLFVRGEKDFFQITNEIKVVEAPTAFGDLTSHWLNPQLESGTGGLEPHPGSSLSGKWYESDGGRQILAEDKKLFAAHFGQQVVATRHLGRIKIRGESPRGTVSVTYPLQCGERELRIEVARDSKVVVSIISDLLDRAIAYAAAIAAYDSL